jgi:hypothetical protein
MDASMEDIYSLFVQATQIDPGARAAWVESLGLPAESREELYALVGELDRYQPGQTKVRTLIVGTVEEALPEPGDRIGKPIGPYRLERLVVDSEGRSAGNMGHVYEARRIDGAFDQTVAVKIIQYLRDDPGGRERFIRERRYLGNLRHPNIVRILDAGSVQWEALDDAQPYFIMEWVEDGLDIVTFGRINGLSVAERLKLFVQVCEGVAYAHSQGVVHRDLKPQNVMVDRHGVPRLLDFGISSGDGDESDQALLRSAMTLAYASPEQLSKQPVGPASDIYSLGVILYELLAGCRPYEMCGDWERDSEFVRGVVIPRVPGAPFDLDRIVQKALRKDLAARYRHVDQLLRDLRRYLNGDPVGASLQYLGSFRGSGYWLYRYARKYLRYLVGLVLLVGCVVLLSAYLGGKQLVQLLARYEGRGLTAEAVLAQQMGDYPLGAALAIEAGTREESFAARSVLQQALPNLPKKLVDRETLPGVARLAAFSPDRSEIVLLLQNGDLQIRSTATGVARAALPLSAPVNWRGASPCAAFSSDGAMFAVLAPGEGVVFWDLTGRRAMNVQRFPAGVSVAGDLDCAGATAGKGLSYRAPGDWDLLVRASGGQYVRVSETPGTELAVETVSDALGCDREHLRCLFRGARGLELRRIGGAGEILQEFPGAREGSLSEEGNSIAVRRESGEIEVSTLSADGRSRSPWRHYNSTSDGRLLMQRSGARLLVDEGGWWRLYSNLDGSSGSYRHDPTRAALLDPSTIDPTSFFLFEQRDENVLAVRVRPGTDPFLIPTEGHVTVRAADDVTGSLVLADQGGRRLAIWKLPSWPGADSVLDVSGQRRWAAGWTRGGELVLYSPVDGSIERVLEGGVPAGGFSSLHVWSVGKGKWLLAQRGSEVSVWDVAGARSLGRAGAGENPVIAVDPGSRWVAITSTHGAAQGSTQAAIYELPSMRMLGSFPGVGILGIASGESANELAVLFATGPRNNPGYHVDLYDTQPFVLRKRYAVADPNNTQWDWSGVRPPIGSPCAAASSGPLAFGFERGESRLGAGCYSIRVDPKTRSLTFAEEHLSGVNNSAWTVRSSPSPRSGLLRVDVRGKDGALLATELVAGDTPPPMMASPGGFALREDGAWHEVSFGFNDLKREACAHLLSPIPAEVRRQYSIGEQSSSCSQ